MIEASVHSYVELSVVDQEGLFDVFLDYELFGLYFVFLLLLLAGCLGIDRRRRRHRLLGLHVVLHFYGHSLLLGFFG